MSTYLICLRSATCCELEADLAVINYSVHISRRVKICPVIYILVIPWKVQPNFSGDQRASSSQTNTEQTPVPDSENGCNGDLIVRTDLMEENDFSPVFALLTVTLRTVNLGRAFKMVNSTDLESDVLTVDSQPTFQICLMCRSVSAV